MENRCIWSVHEWLANPHFLYSHWAPTFLPSSAPRPSPPPHSSGSVSASWRHRLTEFLQCLLTVSCVKTKQTKIHTHTPTYTHARTHIHTHTYTNPRAHTDTQSKAVLRIQSIKTEWRQLGYLRELQSDNFSNSVSVSGYWQRIYAKLWHAACVIVLKRQQCRNVLWEESRSWTIFRGNAFSALSEEACIHAHKKEREREKQGREREEEEKKWEEKEKRDSCSKVEAHLHWMLSLASLDCRENLVVALVAVHWKRPESSDLSTRKILRLLSSWKRREVLRTGLPSSVHWKKTWRRSETSHLMRVSVPSTTSWCWGMTLK